MKIRSALAASFVLALAMPVAAQGEPSELVYFGQRLDGAESAIFGARFDPGSGKLTLLGPVAKVDRPTWVLPSPDRSVIFAASETGNDGFTPGGLWSFAADPVTGALHPLSRITSGGGGATFLTINPRAPQLFVANYGTGHVGLVPIMPGGRLMPPLSVVQDQGSGPHKRQKSAHAHGIAIDPTGQYALVSDLGADKVFVYRIDSKTQALTPNDPPSVAAKPGSGPRHIVFSADGRFVYVNSELTSELTTYAWDAARGALAPLQTISTRLANAAGDNGAGEILVSHDGRFLYASNRGDDSLVVYALDPASGLPREIQRTPAGGRTPWAISFDQTNRWLLVANEGSGQIKVFAHDVATGLLSPTDHTLEVPHVSGIAVVAAQFPDEGRTLGEGDMLILDPAHGALRVVGALAIDDWADPAITG